MITLINLLDDDGAGIGAYDEHVAQFDPITQSFFRQDWSSADYKRTRQGIRARLLTLLKNPTFRRIFSATTNEFQMYSELQTRRLILLDTNKPALDAEGASFLGRMYVAMMMQAAHRRFENSCTNYRKVLFVIDEAQEYFDERIAEMLEQARKAGIGLIVAHQTISQIRKAGLDPATVLGNTATKIVSTQYPDDARDVGKTMRVKPEAILNLPQYSFGLYNRNQPFTSIRAPEHALTDFEFRADRNQVKMVMEERYCPEHSEPKEAAENPIRPSGSGGEFSLGEAEPL